ncbi:DUF6624 domain-containing protein [Streptomyces olivoreticuli]
MLQEPRPSRSDIARELIDRAGRSAGQPWRIPVPGDTSPLSAQDHVDQANTAYVRRVVDEHGWPGKGLVGEDGAQAAARLALRVTDHELQGQLLSLLGQAVRLGEASLGQWAHLYDRCCVRDGKHPQQYGTQYRVGPGGDIEAYRVQDPPTLDERRAEVGLPPYAVSAQSVRRRYHERAAPTLGSRPAAGAPGPKEQPS